MGRLLLLALAVLILVWLVRRALRGPRDDAPRGSRIQSNNGTPAYV